MISNQVIDVKLWQSLRDEAKKKFLVYPSAYASFWISNQYKKRGGKFLYSKPKAGNTLIRWKNEKWVNVCEKKGDTYKACGRTTANLNSSKYPLCRPSVRINSDTPKTVYELSEKEIQVMCKLKRSLRQGVDGKPTRVFFSK